MSFQTDLYDSMLQDVIVATGRPDKEELNELALRQATLNAHLSDNYPRDQVTSLVKLPNAASVVSLDINTLFPRVRGFDTIQTVDNNYNVMYLPEIEIVELGDIYDPEYGNIKDNIAYQAGSSLNIRCTSNSNGYIVGYFAAPQTRRTEYTSWIAQLYPDLIVQWAAALVFTDTGDDDKAARKMKMIDPRGDGNFGMLGTLKANYLLGKAR